jgi:hypothetical protein
MKAPRTGTRTANVSGSEAFLVISLMYTRFCHHFLSRCVCSCVLGPFVERRSRLWIVRGESERSHGRPKKEQGTYTSRLVAFEISHTGCDLTQPVALRSAWPKFLRPCITLHYA